MQSYNEIIADELYERIKAHTAKRKSLSTKDLMDMEMTWADKWKKESMKYGHLLNQMDKERAELLTATREFYDSIKKSLTNNGEVDISMRRTGEYGAYNYRIFPHQLKENVTALAWIDIVGNNSDEMYRLFPNIRDSRLISKKVMREPYCKIDGDMLPEKCNIIPVMTAIKFAMFSDAGIIEVKHRKPSMLGRGSIFIHTPYYYIDISYKGNWERPYELVMTEPAHFDRT